MTRIPKLEVDLENSTIFAQVVEKGGAQVFIGGKPGEIVALFIAILNDLSEALGKDGIKRLFEDWHEGKFKDLFQYAGKIRVIDGEEVKLQ